MTSKIYRTAQGRTVDLGALQLQNETVRAVGNMGVNARGDRLDSQNRVIDSKEKQTKRHYQKQVQTNVTDEPAATSRRRASQSYTQPNTAAKPAAAEPEEIEGLPQAHDMAQPEPVIETVAEPQPVAEPVAGLQGGLAAAIARAREIKQEPLKTPRQLAQEKAGVKKI